MILLESTTNLRPYLYQMRTINVKIPAVHPWTAVLDMLSRTTWAGVCNPQIPTSKSPHELKQHLFAMYHPESASHTPSAHHLICLIVFKLVSLKIS